MQPAILVMREVTAEIELPTDPGTGRWRRWVVGGVVTTSLVLAFFLYAWSTGAEQRAIRELPPNERVGLFERTLANLKSTCTHPDRALRDFCLGQAQFVVQFPECDGACRLLANRQLVQLRPSR